MKTATTVCGRCGARISADATREVCPACLLENGVGLFDGESVAGVVDSGRDDGVPIRDGRKAARSAKIPSDFGDYGLLEEVGRGGQGVVYRAYQKSLNRTVALKVIGLGPWTTETHLKRFRREAEAAASLEHSGIVPIYEVGEEDGQCYFSMKFIEGGQLDEVVRHTPISIRQAAELVAKVARTVHYAHEHGILHRDIKPGNILLDGKGEPLLTDFGLARLIETESTVTRTLEVMGTPSYMAPEQAAGEHTKISKATDVYGLGATLYQLLTSHPPFAGGTTYETLRLLRDTEPRRPRLLNPKVDRDLSTICLKCLEKDPQRRYPSALALSEDLEHWLKHEPIRAKRSGFFTHARKWVRRNPSTTVLVTLLVALAVGVSVTVWNRKPAVLIPKSVAVLPFENLSDDPNSAYFAEGIQEEILTRLAKIEDLKVISRTSTQRYHSKPGNLAEIAKQLGVANIVEGSVQKAADQVRVNVQLINAQTDSHLWADTFDRKLTDIFSVESEVAKAIAEQLNAKLTGAEQKAVADKPTQNLAAYDAYLRGLAFAGGVHDFRTSLLKSIEAFENAVRLDPEFAVAWAHLSRQNGLAFINNVGQAPERREAARMALDMAIKFGPELVETQLAKAFYKYYCERDYEGAKAQLESIRRQYPNNAVVWEYLGGIARRQGQWEQSRGFYAQAVELDPQNIFLLIDAALTDLAMRDAVAAQKHLGRARDLSPQNSTLISFLAQSFQSGGDIAQAQALLDTVQPKPGDGIYVSTAVTNAILLRKYDSALAMLKAQLEQPDALGSALGVFENALGDLERHAGNTAEATMAYQKAKQTVNDLLRAQPENSEFLMQLAWAEACLGEKATAFAHAKQAIAVLPTSKDAFVGPGYEDTLARIEAHFGEKDTAIGALQHLLSISYGSPVTRALLRIDPDWDPLRSDPRFQKLCEERVDKSIAVLPFENLSNNPDNAYFAEGIQEEILTRLVKIGDLKVISRTSTQHYKSAPENLSEIAKQLGVANILEGSVQRVADQVRVNVQLIQAASDSHLWADTYDRKLTDIFGVESDVAKAIADALQAKLTGGEQRALAVKPTNNSEAYDAYLRGLALEARTTTSLNDQAKVVGFYERAVQLDPAFALAWARLSRVNAQTYFAGLDSTTARRDAAERALNTAQKLQPNSPETLLAQAYYQYWVLRDYDLAKATFGRVRELLPGSSDVPGALALIARRQGHWDESVAYWEQTLVLDPRNTEWLASAAETYAALRQFPAALKTYDRLLDIVPNDPNTVAFEARIYQAESNLEQAGKLLAGVNAQTPSFNAFLTKMDQLFLERHFDEALRLIHSRLTESRDLSDIERWFNPFLLVLAQENAGDIAGARATAQQMLRPLETLCQKDPDNPNFAQALSVIHAVLGQKDAAIKEAERAIALLPTVKDAVAGPGYEENLAYVEVLVGDKNRAIPRLQRLLETPYTDCLTPALLSLNPQWDALRDDPRFQKLCEEKQP